MGVHHLKWMLELIGLAPAQSHDVLVAATGMALSCLVVEVAFS
jgi:hypothetical protein